MKDKKTLQVECTDDVIKDFKNVDMAPEFDEEDEK